MIPLDQPVDINYGVKHVQEWFNWQLKSVNMACPKETASFVCLLKLGPVGLGLVTVQ